MFSAKEQRQKDSSQVLVGKNVSRKGAKLNENDLILAPLRLCGKCLVVPVLLCAFLVVFLAAKLNHRGTQNTEVAQRSNRFDSVKSRRDLGLLIGFA